MRTSSIVLVGSALLSIAAACGDSKGDDVPIGDAHPSGGDDNGGDDGDDHGGSSFGDGDGGTSTGDVQDPKTCDEARSAHSYIGCDYWPTVVPSSVGNINSNPTMGILGCKKLVTSIAISNTGKNAANVTITNGKGGQVSNVTIAPNESALVDLPNVPELDDFLLAQSRILEGGAFRVVSDVPVVVYQFDPYRTLVDCGSNVASVLPNTEGMTLLPSTALADSKSNASTYRIMSVRATKQGGVPFSPALTITATEANTKVTVLLSKTAGVKGANGVPSGASGGTVEFSLAKAGDVAQLMGTGESDFSGSLVKADKPIQALVSTTFPAVDGTSYDTGMAEEAMQPVESLGKHYVVPPVPKSGSGEKSQLVRFYGNEAGTKLTYGSGAAPKGCPTALEPQQVAECVVDAGFDVTADKSFGIMLIPFATGNGSKTAAMTSLPSVEQGRKSYVVTGFSVESTKSQNPHSWIVATGPKDAGITLDGAPITAEWTPITGSSLGSYFIPLPTGKDPSTHVIEATQRIGALVIAKDYPELVAYPAGLNVAFIAPPPVN